MNYRIDYKLDVKQLVNDLRGPKGLKALSEEMAKIVTEISKLQESLKPQAEAQLKRAQSELKGLEKRLTKIHSQVKKTLNKKVARRKKPTRAAGKKKSQA